MIASAMTAVSAAMEDTPEKATMMNVVMVKNAKPKSASYWNRVGEIRVWVLGVAV